MRVIKKIKTKIIASIFNENSNRKQAQFFFIILDLLRFQRILGKIFPFFNASERVFLYKYFGLFENVLPFISTYRNISDGNSTYINKNTLMVAFSLLRCGEGKIFENWINKHIYNIWLYVCDGENKLLKESFFSANIVIDKIIEYANKNDISLDMITNVQVKVKVAERSDDYESIKFLYINHKIPPSFFYLKSLAISLDPRITSVYSDTHITDGDRIKFLQFLAAKVDSGTIEKSYIFNFSIWLINNKNFNNIVKSEAIEITCRKFLIEQNYYSAYIIGYFFTKKYPHNERLNFSLAGAAFMMAGEKEVVKHLRPILEEKSQTDYFLWRMAILLSTLISHESLKILITGQIRKRVWNYSKGKGLEFFFEILFGNSNEGILGVDRRSKYGHTVFPEVGNDKSENDLFFCSIKNINYAYILSSSYESYKDLSGVICDERFVKVFENSFPRLKFYGVKRPEDLPENLSKWYGSDLKDNLINLYNRFHSQKLSLQTIKKNRKKGWLKPCKNKNLLKILDIKDSIKIGISIGTGIQTGLRGYNNLPYNIFEELFTRPNLDFYNLDYFADKKLLKKFGIKSPDIDLKNDMLLFGKLVSELDLIICIPNNIMDAAAAYGTPAYVFDPLKRFSYWGQGRGHKYFFSDGVEFVSGSDRTEALDNLKMKVEKFVTHIYDNENYK